MDSRPQILERPNADSAAEYLTPLETARLLQLSTDRVRQLDGVLQPLRTTSGRRFYRRVNVERLAEERRAAAVCAAMTRPSPSVRS